MDVEELTGELVKRAAISNSKISHDFCRTLASLIIRYNVKLTMDSFKATGVLMKDELDKSVALYSVSVKDGFLSSETDPYSDVLIVENGGIVLGWVHRDKVNASSGFAVGVKALTPLPTEFAFRQICPHLSVYGGLWHDEETSWECFGCDEFLPDFAS